MKKMTKKIIFFDLSDLPSFRALPDTSLLNLIIFFILSLLNTKQILQKLKSFEKNVVGY